MTSTLAGATFSGALTEADVVEARAELALGRPVTVWFTPAAVGVPAGGSARIVAIGDPPEGEFVQVRPAGSRDEMFCSPGELTRSRPSRRRADAASPASRAPAKRARSPAAATAPTRTAVVEPAPVDAEPPAPKTPRRRPSRPQPADVTVTLHSGPDGEWQVSVVSGKRTVVRTTAVAAGDVARAAQCLPAEVGAAVQESLAAARVRQEERVAALQAELAAARQALADLGG